MINRIVADVAQAVTGVADGAVVMIGGFGDVGQPHHLINALADAGPVGLTVIANNAGSTAASGVGKLIARGQVRKMICSFPRFSQPFEERWAARDIELELVPQGSLAERIRAGGAGIAAFYTPTGFGTALGEGKDVRYFGGVPHIMETALTADVALLECWQADRWGNLRFRTSGRNFNPMMGLAARQTIVQAQHVVELGEIDPDDIHLPGVAVNRVVHVPYGQPAPARSTRSRSA
ncbi:MAG: 3-oxoacid CoA-transferase subunit A [Propionibacteriaceae bacterium]|nr:3-oxoacid CoA-transferase subunit A [Propionibacteriaceae bacterium]